MLLVTVAVFVIFLHKTISTCLPQQQHVLSTHSSSSKKSPVALEVHIMSKCPDAKDCLIDLIIPVMSRIHSSNVNFTLSYLGRPTLEDDGVECMHGPSECLGNILQLCGQKEYADDPVRWLGFAGCTTGQYKRIAERALIQECAAEYGMSFEKLNDCASTEDGQVGIDLLKESVTRSKNAGVTKSCTIRLNNKIRCIRDGANWSDCPGGSTPEDLIRDIEAMYKQEA